MTNLLLREISTYLTFHGKNRLMMTSISWLVPSSLKNHLISFHSSLPFFQVNDIRNNINRIAWPHIHWRPKRLHSHGLWRPYAQNWYLSSTIAIRVECCRVSCYGYSNFRRSNFEAMSTFLEEIDWSLVTSHNGIWLHLNRRIYVPFTVVKKSEKVLHRI